MIKPRKYQLTGVDFILDRLYVEDIPGCGIFADPGLGKTYITLLAIERLRELGHVKRTLVVAPLQTCLNTWPTEIEQLGFDFRSAVLHGNRKAKLLLQNNEIDIINPDGLKWLLGTCRCPWDLIICDESTLFKNWSAGRSRKLRTLLKKIPKRIILTGTPTPNSYVDLHSQAYILDDGERLGKTVGFFRQQYCTPSGFRGYGWSFREDREQDLLHKLNDIVIRFDEDDHLDLPVMNYNPLWVTLPANIMREYRRLENDMFVELEQDKALGATNAGAKYQMCKQLANGGLYENDDPLKRKQYRTSHHIHTTKVDRFRQLYDECGSNMIATYQVDHDLERLQTEFKNTPTIKGGTKNSKQIIDDWNANRVPLMFVQPQALSHGVNLQHGGNHICWLGLTDQNEIFQQFNKRLHRSGQTKPVFIHMILARNTVDEMVWDRLRNKGRKQKSLLDSLRDYKRNRNV